MGALTCSRLSATLLSLQLSLQPSPLCCHPFPLLHPLPLTAPFKSHPHPPPTTLVPRLEDAAYFFDAAPPRASHTHAPICQPRLLLPTSPLALVPPLGSSNPLGDPSGSPSFSTRIFLKSLLRGVSPHGYHSPSSRPLPARVRSIGECQS